MSKNNDLEICHTPEDVAQKATQEFVRLANAVIARGQVFAVALSGGSTPKRLYQLLAEEKGNGFPEAWKKIHLFFGDERHVPPDHAESNFRMVKEALLSHIDMLAENIHRITAENPDANAAAIDYEREMKSFFTKTNKMADGFPVFDLILLGMGPDGHTASLFPGSAGLEEKLRWIISNPVEKFKTDRITLTYPVLNHAANILFLICGEDKAAMIGEVLGTKADATVYPVQRVKPVHGTKRWLLDKAAAKELKN